MVLYSTVFFVLALMTKKYTADAFLIGPLTSSAKFSAINRRLSPAAMENEDWVANMPPTSPLTTKLNLIKQSILPVSLFTLQSFLLALLLVAWEDITCANTLQSRHRTSQQWQNTFGAHTVKGMGFGYDERMNLLFRDDLNQQIMSYNEVMRQHREERVTRWRTETSAEETRQSIHTLLSCLRTVHTLQEQAEDYQWDAVRRELRSEPLSRLEPAASYLRRIIDKPLQKASGEGIVGFDWGSCAWRHCGALADAQEALDELDFMLGVLEPYEAIFCLDIVERSLRDILTYVPWKIAAPEDTEAWRGFPSYQPKVSQATDGGEDDGASRIDEAYFRALQELRVD